MPETPDPAEGTSAAVTTPTEPQAPDAAAVLAAVQRENAILKAGVTLDSDRGKYLVANPTLDVAGFLALVPAAPATPAAPVEPATPSAAQAAQLQAAQLAAQGDAEAAAAVAARQLLTSGATGDPTVPDVHPTVLAKKAIADGINTQHLSVSQAMALGVAQIMNAAAKGDTRVNYVGRTAPGA